MTTRSRRLMPQGDRCSVSVVSRRARQVLGAAAAAGALLCGTTALPVAQAAQPAAGGLEACPADTFCVDGVARQVVDRVPDLSLGEGQPGAFALVPGDSLRPAFAVQNLGSQPVSVVVRMDWRNDRCIGQSFAQDPHLSSLPHPGGQTRFYSPGMRAAVEYGGSRLTAESLRCTGSTQTSQITMSPGERLDFQGLVDFPLDSNLNDTQRERVWLGFSIQVTAQDLVKVSVPQSPEVEDPCGPGNARWLVPADTERLDWTLGADGVLLVAPRSGFVLESGEAVHSYGTAPDSGAACPGASPLAPSPQAPPSQSGTGAPAPPGQVGPGQTGPGSSQGSGTGWFGRPGSSGSPALAVTGVDLLGVGAGVGGLLLLGGLLLAWRRRRGRQEDAGQ